MTRNGCIIKQNEPRFPETSPEQPKNKDKGEKTWDKETPFCLAGAGSCSCAGSAKAAAGEAPLLASMAAAVLKTALAALKPLKDNAGIHSLKDDSPYLSICTDFIY